jgi:hypothetical protein
MVYDKAGTLDDPDDPGAAPVPGYLPRFPRRRTDVA